MLRAPSIHVHHGKGRASVSDRDIAQVAPVTVAGRSADSVDRMQRECFPIGAPIPRADVPDRSSPAGHGLTPARIPTVAWTTRTEG